MEETVVRKKRELVLFSITVIAVAFLVSTLANIIFDIYYEDNKSLYIIVSSISLISLIIFSFWFYLSERFKSKTDVSFVYTFSRKKLAFIDLPNCVPSVNARVLFDKMPIDLKNHYKKLDHPDSFWSSDFEDYINNITQSIIIARVIRQDPPRTNNNWHRIKLNNLPLNLRNNKCLKDYFDHEELLWMPNEIKIETFGSEEKFIRIKSKFGKMDFKWQVAYCNTGHLSEPFVSLLELESGEDYHDFLININLSIDHNLAKFISKKLADYLVFVENIKSELSRYDWKTTERLMPIELLSELIAMQKSNTKTNA